MKRLLKIKEVAEILNISVITLYIWVSNRRIPFLKIGGAVRFKIEDIDFFIESKRID